MKSNQSVHFDNIATASHPVWRRRLRKPFTCHAVRAELIAQAAELPHWEQDAYISARLTDLDKALGADQAEAIERWLDCEELLQGRPATLGDGAARGSGHSSLLDDEALPMLAEHAQMRRRLSGGARISLEWLVLMMEQPKWELNAYFVLGVCRAAAELTKLHSSLHT